MEESSTKTFDDIPKEYRFIDILILAQIVLSFACHQSELILEEQTTKKRGFAIFMSIVCHCGYSRNFYSSTTSVQIQILLEEKRSI